MTWCTWTADMLFYGVPQGDIIWNRGTMKAAGFKTYGSAYATA